MWSKINSPIVITIIAIVSVFALKITTKPKLVTEVRGVFEELNTIIEDSASDAEKNKAVRKFAQEIATQIREGFSVGMKKTDSKEKNYIATYSDKRSV